MDFQKPYCTSVSCSTYTWTPHHPLLVDGPQTSYLSGCSSVYLAMAVDEEDWGTQLHQVTCFSAITELSASFTVL